MIDFDLSQFRDLFVDEARGHLQALNTNLLALERNRDETEALETMFRAAHSLKGGAATMGYDALATLAHATEDVMDNLRRGRWSLTPSLAELLFAALDVLQALLADVAAGREEPTVDTATMLARLQGYDPAQESAPAVPQTLPAGVAETVGRAAVIRVDVRHLDALLNIVTEMVIHRSLLNRLSQRYALTALDDALQAHDRLLTQLRDAVLEMRMVPVSQVFDRFPRMVRDLLKAQGKEAQLVIEGARVEMDRTALEALNDPLVHLLRNAVDHGLELPAERVAAGKPPAGTLRLSARRERDSVIIELSDDGRGMEAGRIAAAAVERGLVAPEAVAEMSEGQALGLICHPNFSLSKEVTAVSGRGVGMSVVKREVEALRGTLEIETQPGRGSAFRLQLPVMLALVNAMLVQVGEEQYALPVTQVERIIELEPAQIERIGERQVATIEGEVLPLLWLGHLLQIPDASPDPRFALVVRRNGQVVGLQVDAVLGREEIVVKPLPAALRGTPGLAGVTILGEGQTVLILDVGEAVL